MNWRCLFGHRFDVLVPSRLCCFCSRCGALSDGAAHEYPIVEATPLVLHPKSDGRERRLNWYYRVKEREKAS